MRVFGHFWPFLCKISPLLHRFEQLFTRKSSIVFNLKPFNIGAMHTNPSLDCESCAQKLLWCHPDIVSFTKITQAQFKNCHVAVGYRDAADQEIAISSGKSKLAYPNSLHNNMLQDRPQSLAVDLFLLDLDGKALFPITYYDNIYHYYLTNKDMFSYEILWGGDWNTFKDWDHFQLKL